MSLPTPSSRREYFLASAAGEPVTRPPVLSREDQYLSGIAERLEALAAGSAAFRVVSSLPETGEPNTLYLVPESIPLYGRVLFAKYAWVADQWESLSSVEMAKDMTYMMLRWFDEAMESAMYGRIRDYVVSFQGHALHAVYTDTYYAGQTAQITVINSTGKHTASVTIRIDGSLPIEAFSVISGEWNLIFCETDPTQKNENILAGPTAIPLCVVFENRDAEFADVPFQQFLQAQNLQAEYVLVDPDVEELDFQYRAYFLKYHTDYEPIWERIGSTNGDYYVRVETRATLESIMETDPDVVICTRIFREIEGGE